MTVLIPGFRRSAASAVLISAMSLVANASHAQTVTAVMHAGLRSLDPEITTAYIVRNYGYMVYDTLLAIDGNQKIQPQMVDKWTASEDGKTYTFVLRDGLKWHDGTPVTAEDCIVSIDRWSQLDKMGQLMRTMLESSKAIDAKTFTMTFKERTDLVLRALAKPSGVGPFMMPKRIAQTPPSEAIKESIGSGPFRFVASEYKPGVQAVFEKFKDYVPRKEPASGMAGGKVVNIERVKWVTMPDQMTAVNAILNKEIDFIEQVPIDLLPMLESSPDVTVTEYKVQGAQNVVRLNFSQPPFDNKLVRQAAMLAMDQKDVLQAQIGNPKYYRTCSAILGCGTAWESDVSGDKVSKGQIEKAAQLLKQAKYDGTPVVILHPTDVAVLAAMPPVYAQALKKAGFNVQLQAMDWQTVGVRRTSREPGNKGGWSIFSTYNSLADVGDPLGFVGIAANGKDAWFGWPSVPAIEEVRAKIARTSDTAALKKLSNELQRLAVEEVMTIPLGQFSAVTAKTKTLTNQVVAPVPVFWNMTKAGK